MNKILSKVLSRAKLKIISIFTFGLGTLLIFKAISLLLPTWTWKGFLILGIFILAVGAYLDVKVYPKAQL